jgi:UDP-glucose 4-epimerase
MNESASGQCWLVAGGAGYIGAHVVRSLQAAGASAVVLDDLSSGVRERVDVPFVHGDVGDVDLVTDTLRTYSVAGVVQLAAAKQVEQSMHRPLHYYRRNVVSLMQLLTAMQRAEVDRLVFSSSAAVYGMVDSERVHEDDRTEPINPYGETKLIGEWLLRDQARATGLRFAALRYFNVVGAAAPELGDRGRSNLVPMIFEALRRGRRPRIFGSDYPTPDGTCVRDYIHVADLADAHVAAIAALGEPAAELIVNVGCGRGYSVREVVATVAEVVGVELDPEFVDPRPGDPASVVADTSRIRQVLGWQARHDLTDMVRSAWQAEQARAEQAEAEQSGTAVHTDPALTGGR